MFQQVRGLAGWCADHVKTTIGIILAIVAAIWAVRHPETCADIIVTVVDAAVTFFTALWDGLSRIFDRINIHL